MIEDVEELGAELGADAFGDLGGLEKREVEVDEVGAGEGVAAEVADGSRGGCEEGRRIEVLGGGSGVEVAFEAGVDVGADGVAGVS